LVRFPQISVSKNVYQNPFKAPATFAVRDKEKVRKLDSLIETLDYVHDGVFFTDARTLKDCIDPDDEFQFGERWSRPAAGRQLVHRSGTIFVRILTDNNGLALVVVLANYLFMQKDDHKMKPVAVKAFEELAKTIGALNDGSLDELEADRNRFKEVTPTTETLAVDVVVPSQPVNTDDVKALKAAEGPQELDLSAVLIDQGEVSSIKNDQSSTLVNESSCDIREQQKDDFPLGNDTATSRTYSGTESDPTGLAVGNYFLEAGVDAANQKTAGLGAADGDSSSAARDVDEVNKPVVSGSSSAPPTESTFYTLESDSTQTEPRSRLATASEDSI
jgi:hypothetical protein